MDIDKKRALKNEYHRNYYHKNKQKILAGKNWKTNFCYIEINGIKFVFKKSKHTVTNLIKKIPKNNLAEHTGNYVFVNK